MNSADLMAAYEAEVKERRKKGEEVAVAPISADDFIDLRDRAYRMMLEAQEGGARQIALLLAIFADASEVIGGALAALELVKVRRRVRRSRASKRAWKKRKAL